MAVDMQLHILNFDPEMLRIFSADSHGWDPERPGKVILQNGLFELKNGIEEVISEVKYNEAYKTVALSPQVFIGRAGGHPTPYAVREIFFLFGGYKEDGKPTALTEITDDVIRRADYAFKAHRFNNEADRFYTVANGEDVVEWLKAHKGEKAFKVCW
jgi:hypothetical protein